MDQDCPNCGKPLEYDDYFGHHVGGGEIKKAGDIYRCTNEECEERFYHTLDGDSELRTGYPC